METDETERLHITILSVQFSEDLLFEIGQETLLKVVTLNNAGKTNVCHTHDFCDANQVMITAFEQCFNRAPASNDSHLISCAWEEAKEFEFLTGD